MHRIDDPTAVPTLPAPRPQGTPGYFTGGSPGSSGFAATVVRYEFMNALQEEVSAVIEATGIALDKTNNSQLLAAIRAGAGPRGISVFTSSGTFTVPVGVGRVKVTVVGGGASGGSMGTTGGWTGSGGGAGGAAIKYVSGLTPGNTVVVTVGQGGASPAGSTTTPGGLNGNPGGTSSFGAFCSATGGKAGVGATGGNPYGIGDGGLGSGGDLNFEGGAGIDAQGNGTVPAGGGGGNSIFGGAGRAATARVASEQDGGAYGAGGGAAYSAPSLMGGAGAGGVVIIEW
jgi:hypothetical protein